MPNCNCFLGNECPIRKLILVLITTYINKTLKKSWHLYFSFAHYSLLTALFPFALNSENPKTLTNFSSSSKSSSFPSTTLLLQ